MMATSNDTDDIDSFWEYGDVAVSAGRFQAALQTARGERRLELLTQLARTDSLRGRFAEAHATLDDVEAQLAQAGARAQSRYALERGRTFNSSGNRERARALFVQAWEIASFNQLEGLAVDAAHMVAIAASGQPESIEWNERGLVLARAATDTKARALIPALLNNNAWELHTVGRFEEALAWFEAAEAEWRARARPVQIQIAQWSVARCLRSLGRWAEALVIQRGLEAEHRAAGTVDGYVFEELAENLAALGQGAEAQPYFGLAFAALSQEAGLADHEPERLARLKLRADGGPHSSSEESELN